MCVKKKKAVCCAGGAPFAVTVGAGGTVGSLLDAAAAAVGSQRPVTLLYQGRRLGVSERETTLADSGLSQEATVDVVMEGRLECVAHNPAKLSVGSGSDILLEYYDPHADELCQDSATRGGCASKDWMRQPSADTVAVQLVSGSGGQAYLAPRVSTSGTTVWHVDVNEHVFGGANSVGIMAEDVPLGTDMESLTPSGRRLLGADCGASFDQWKGSGRFWCLEDCGSLMGPGISDDGGPAYGRGAHMTVTLSSGLLQFDIQAQGRSYQRKARVPLGLPVLLFVSLYDECAAMHVRLE
eukprot:TRINITY_DN9581_c0_g1_i1.p1 TRINITY_DN9581_c0_g1~~TRINITY_DN9581_c0_g1_i1.p1  ORF type:complete len:296 (+),score=93.08 TRINITY_DN9581_c0_g1_i1:197-1084(+)